MALAINGTNISPQKDMFINGAAQKELSIDGVQVWKQQKELLVYNYGSTIVGWGLGTGNTAGGSFRMNDDNIFLQAVSTSGGTQVLGAGTTSTIDLTAYNRMEWVTTGAAGDYYQALLGVRANRQFFADKYNIGWLKRSEYIFPQTFTMDISDIQGSYYLGFRVIGDYYGSGSVRVYKIRLYNV